MEQGGVGPDQQLLVQPQQDVQLLRDQCDVVFCLLQGQPVVGQLHFAAQHIVVGDESLFLHAADVVQAPFRLLDVARQDLLLAVEAKQLQVRFQQIQLQIRGIRFALQRRQRPLHACPADRMAQLAAPVYGLREIYDIILRPVRSVGTVRIAQSPAEYYGLSDESAAQADLEVRQAVGPGPLFPDPGGILLQRIGLKLQAVLQSQFEEPVHRKKEGVPLCCGRLHATQTARQQQQVPTFFPVHRVRALGPMSCCEGGPARCSFQCGCRVHRGWAGSVARIFPLPG